MKTDDLPTGATPIAFTLDGARIISPKTWEFMRQNHLPENQTMRGMGRSAFTEVMADGVGFGLGQTVVEVGQHLDELGGNVAIHEHSPSC